MADEHNHELVDEWVAEHVHGYKRVTAANGATAWATDGEGRYVTDLAEWTGLLHFSVPPFTTDVAWDYLSHQVACSWLFSRRMAYFQALDGRLQDMAKHKAREAGQAPPMQPIAWPNVLMWYWPGAYSLAALGASHGGDEFALLAGAR